MINESKITPVIDDYKKVFDKRMVKPQDEIYKWRAVKQWKNNWNIDAPDFKSMFETATSKAGTLLSARNYMARGMILEFADAAPEDTREMFRNLFDESKNVNQRALEFKHSCENIRSKYNPGTWDHDFQSISSISCYLWFEYPEKYYILKYNWLKSLSTAFGDAVQVKTGDYMLEHLSQYTAYTDEIRSYLQKDPDLRSSLQKYLNDETYDDPELNVLTVDFCHYAVYTYFKSDKEEKNDQDSNKNIHYWIYSPGDNASKWNECLKDGIMVLGWDEIGDYSDFQSKSDIAKKMQDFQRDSASHSNDALACWQFYKEMKPGDVVFAKKGRDRLIGRGVVTSEYYYAPERTDYLNCRKVDWTDKGEWPHPGAAVLKTLTDITKYKDYVKKLNALIDDSGRKKPITYTIKDFLKKVYISREEYSEIRDLLENKKNIILQGPPGVGKTFASRKLAYSVMGQEDDSRIEFIQFHQNYTYEDFMMGYKPKEDGGYELQEGVFYQFCKKAEYDNRPYFFIIDEINRGNLSRIFGELLMALEYRKETVRLQYRDEQFHIPENVYIVGMMNTADRSLAMIDYALRRRFSFVTLKPEFDSEGFKEYQNSLHNDMFDRLIEEIRKLNETIIKDDSLGEGFCIGHSYFCNMTPETCTSVRLKEIVKYDIIPTLQEYWFDDKNTLKEWTKKLEDIVR